MATVRWGGLRPEPYDPDARDADGDGIVQEGTAFERPAGTRLLNEIGQEIARGSMSATRPEGMRVVDASGADVDYTPTYGRGVPATDKSPSPRHLGVPNLKDRGARSLGEIVHGPEQPKPARPPATPAAPPPPIKPQPDQTPLLRLPSSAKDASLVDTSTFVASRLNPKEEISEDGTPRSIFERDGSTFTFKSFLESPVYPTLSNSDVEIIGANRLPGGGALEDDVARYADTVSKLRPTNPAGKHYVVDRTPDGMLELALRFDPENKELQSLRDEIRSGVYSDQGILLLDAMAAAVSMDSDGNLMPDENPNPDGDGLVLLALLGDTEAQADLASRVAKLHALDAEEEAKRVREVRAEYDRVPPPELGPGAETPSTDDFSLVHTLRYEPKRDKDGNVVLQTRFDADGFSRPSLHTTVNHMVEGHLMANWDDTQFVVVMPMTDLVEKNGAPANLNAIDTWWLRDPGEKLVAPKAIILKPSSNESVELSAEVGDDIFYKTSNFTPEDATTIVDEMFGRGGVESDKLSDELSAEIAEVIAGFREDPNAYLSGFVSQDDKEQIAKIIAEMLEKDPSRVESTLRYLSKRRAFNLALEKQQVARARPSGWQTNQSPRLSHVAKELDVVAPIHSNSPEGRHEVAWWDTKAPTQKIPNFPPDINPKTRRVVVASGVMATRRPAKRVSEDDDYVPRRPTL